MVNGDTPSTPKLRKQRCPNGTRKNRKTGICEKPVIIQPRCKNGFRRNRKTRECEDKTKKKLPNLNVIKKLSRKKMKSIIDNESAIRREKNMSPLNDNASDKLKKLRFPSNVYFKGIKTINDAVELAIDEEKREKSVSRQQERKSPERKSPEHKSPEHKSPEHKSPERKKTPEQERKTPERKTPERKTPERKTFERHNEDTDEVFEEEGVQSIEKANNDENELSEERKEKEDIQENEEIENEDMENEDMENNDDDNIMSELLSIKKKKQQKNAMIGETPKRKKSNMYKEYAY
jgi:hypothetical protein